MKLESKYNIGDTVYKLTWTSKEYKEICPICEGKRKYIVNGNEIYCRECFNGKITKHTDKQWYISGPLTIGQVEVIVRLKGRCKTKNKIKVEYMAIETGIGSGSIHHEDTLYPTLEEAQREADKRNKENFREQDYEDRWKDLG